MNPYSLRTMIRDPNVFIGRSAELHDIYTLLSSSQSCSIVGPRRIGKSSLLYHLVRPESYTPHLPNADTFVLAFMDLQELAGLGADDFFYTAVERLNRAGAGRLAADPERDGTMSAFRRMLARATDAGLRLVLCCDEFEMLSQNSRFNADFFAYLRGLCSNYNLALVTSSRASLYDLCHQGNLQTSQFWNIFVERALGLMPDDEAHTLVAGPFERAGAASELINDAVRFVLDLAGTHPLFIQIAGYHLFEALENAGGEALDVEAITLRFQEESHPHYAYAWSQLDEIEQSTLLGVLRGVELGESIQVEPALFHRLKRSAAINGSPESPRLISSGWRAFLGAQSHMNQATIRPPMVVTPPKLDDELTAKSQVRSVLVPPAHDHSFEPYQIGRYRVEALLGRGGQAAVFRGHDPMFKRDVAIKVLPAEFLNNPIHRARFEREAQTIASLEHLAIVPVYDFGEMDEQLYFVMRYMPHGSLVDQLKHGSLSLEDSARIISRMASALDEAHAHGIVHRDLKPGNILFDQYGNAFLSDFGIARLAQSSGTATYTGIVGTPAYMSPEQVTGEREVDGRSDVYALGVILFEMLAGRPPYDADTPSGLMLKHVNEPVPDVLAHNPDLPQGLKPVLAHALAKNPDHRYPTGGEFATVLAALIRE
ncbi:MAG: protein kinase [Burkholderiales bacterium]|nr:protein kinase [Anaerolineae bacterium]